MTEGTDSMRNTARALACILASLALANPARLAAQAAPQPAIKAPAQAAKPPAPAGFSAEGGAYTAIAEASGKDASEAQERARNAALGLLFKGLGKDRLFAEVFVGSPPVGLVFTLLSSTPEGGQVKARVSVAVDDESVRIVERGPYLAAALSLLDKAEKASVEADAKAAQGSAAEAEAKLGEALVAYGIAQDSSRSGLSLIEGIGDSSIFSSEGKRTAPDLRRALGAAGDSAVAGIGRVRAAQAALEADETGKAIGESVRRAIAAADHGDALLEESSGILSDPSAYGPERLSPLRDRLSVERRAISDAEADLGRAKAALPKDKGYRSDELEFARRRLSTVDSALASAYRSVDREIRDPAARRAARARAIRWAFLHAPTERLALRAYLPLALEPQEENALATAPFDFSVSAEGAFPLGSGGIWARTRASSSTLDLSSDREGDEEYAISQSFSIGFWRRTLLYAGYSWDWYRGFDGEKMPKAGQVELGLGGVSPRGRSDGLRRADWLLALSYDIPYDLDDFHLWNALNAGLEAQFRLGDLALIEASASQRLHEGPVEGELDAVFAWAIGFGLRLPPPFILGGEYRGDLVWPLESDGGLGKRAAGGGGAFRFYVGYSL